MNRYAHNAQEQPNTKVTCLKISWLYLYIATVKFMDRFLFRFTGIYITAIYNHSQSKDTVNKLLVHITISLCLCKHDITTCHYAGFSYEPEGPTGTSNLCHTCDICVPVCLCVWPCDHAGGSWLKILSRTDGICSDNVHDDAPCEVAFR